MVGDRFRERGGTEYEVVWDGESDRHEVCFSLLGSYARPSALAELVQIDRRVKHDTHGRDPRVQAMKQDRMKGGGSVKGIAWL